MRLCRSDIVTRLLISLSQHFQSSKGICNFLMQKGSEDCLFINVWSPDLDGMSEVMVYIHGGQLLHGSGNEPGIHILLAMN